MGTIDTDRARGERLMELFEAERRLLGFAPLEEGDDSSRWELPDNRVRVHPPLMGVDEPTLFRLSDLREKLRWPFVFCRPESRDLHAAVHPDRDTLAVWYTGTVAFRFFPWVTLMTQSIMLVIEAKQVGEHLKMAALHEHAALSPEAAGEILQTHHGWPQGSPGLLRVDPR